MTSPVSEQHNSVVLSFDSDGYPMIYTLVGNESMAVCFEGVNKESTLIKALRFAADECALIGVPYYTVKPGGPLLVPHVQGTASVGSLTNATHVQGVTKSFGNSDMSSPELVRHAVGTPHAPEKETEGCKAAL